MNNNRVRRELDQTPITLFTFFECTFDAMPFDQASDLHQQFFVAERKIDVVVGAGVQTVDAAMVCGNQSADQHHGDVGGARVFFQTAAKFETAHYGHNNVADDEVRMKRKGEFDGLCAIQRRRDFITFEFEKIDKQIEDLPIIIDDQDSASL